MGTTMGKNGHFLDALPSQGTLHVVMLGLDSAGKTTALYRLKFNQYLNTVPTIGFNCEKVQGMVGKAKGVQFLVWDVGGQEKLRPLWRSYTRCTDGILFVVDSVDVERMEEAKMELMRTAKCPDNQFQFETAVSRNGWDDGEKALELILVLKGVAAEILETMPASCRNNYNVLMTALQQKFGDEHKRQLYRVELRYRTQKDNESLQAFAVEGERLVQLSYPLENHPLIDDLKTEAFVSGIRFPDIKLAVTLKQLIKYILD